MGKKLKIILFCLLIVLLILIAIFCYFFIGFTHISKNIIWGVDFSQMQAEYLKLDWKEFYLAMISDLGVKNVKIHTQWDWIEGKRGEYYFDDVDWQLAKAEEAGVKVIYVLGMKTGRWPECHLPVWAESASENEVKAELFQYITRVVERYKNSEAIVYWQVENEPLFKFGKCPPWYCRNKELLEKEISLVKSLDPTREIIVSDSGELSTWMEVAKISDIVGVTMYRNAWSKIKDTFKINPYIFLSSELYHKKADLIEKMYEKKVICIELQAEPWVSKPIAEAPLAEQLESMNLDVFKKNVEFAKQTGFDTFYFWGTEWWYWLKTKQNSPEIWQEAEKLFKYN